MHRKKILHITQATGGVKTYTAQVLEYADSRQFEFVVVAPADVLFEEFCRSRSVRYYRINLERSVNPFQNLGIVYNLIKIIRRECPDLLHVHSAKGGFLGRLAGRWTRTKVVYTPHAFSYLPFTGLKRMIFFGLECLVRKWTDVLLAISHSEANRAIFEVGFSRKQVKVIVNAIPVSEYPPVRNYMEGRTIRMIGRLTPQKNHMLFLKIAVILLRKYPQLEFSILGAGIHDDLMAEIRIFLVENGLQHKISIEDWGSTETSRQFLKEADIFVMPSVFEGLPFSLLEAMEAGVPCVVSKVDGNTDVIHNNENGFACLSLEEFCEKIEQLVSDAPVRQKLGLAGYEYVKKVHNIQKTIPILEDTYRTLSAGY